jgi:hypothetical protein
VLLVGMARPDRTFEGQASRLREVAEQSVALRLEAKVREEAV